MTPDLSDLTTAEADAYRAGWRGCWQEMVGWVTRNSSAPEAPSTQKPGNAGTYADGRRDAMRDAAAVVLGMTVRTDPRDHGAVRQQIAERLLAEARRAGEAAP